MAQHETKLLKDDSTKESCYRLTGQAFPALFPIFCLALGAETGDDVDSLNIADVAVVVLTSVAVCVADVCVRCVVRVALSSHFTHTTLDTSHLQ